MGKRNATPKQLAARSRFASAARRAGGKIARGAKLGASRARGIRKSRSGGKVARSRSTGTRRRRNMARKKGHRRGQQGIVSWLTSMAAILIGLGPLFKELAY